MNDISISMKELVDIVPKIDDMSIKISGIGNKLSSIRHSLDMDIRCRQDIGENFNAIYKELNNLAESITRSSAFVNNAVESYEEAEQRLVQSFNEIDHQAEISVNDKKDEGDSWNIIDTISKVLRSIRSFLKSSIKHISDFFDKSGEVINNKYEHKQETSIPELDGILSINNNNEYNYYVKVLQQRLNVLGYTDSEGKPLKEDGYFNYETLEVVNKFKDEKGLWNFGQYAGKVGETTWGYLFNEEKTSEINNIGEKTHVKQSTREYGNPSYKEIVDYIKNKCNEIGLPEDIGLAIAWTESGMTQFKGDNIPEANINKNSSQDWGIMQLNDRYWGDNLERIQNDWKYNIDCGLGYAYDRYNKAIQLGEKDLARATYAGYNSGSNLDRYRTESDSRDERFFKKYQTKPWEDKINIEPVDEENNKVTEQNDNNIDTKSCEDKINTESVDVETNIITDQNYYMTDTTVWNAVKPLYTYDTGERTAQVYNKLIDQFNVKTNPRYIPRDNTYCNIFAWDVSIAMGVELPRFVEVNEIGNLEDATGKAIGRNLGEHILYQNKSNYNADATELNANRLAIWLDAQGENYGWKEISPEEAQKRANQGYMTISCIDKSPDTGHVQVIRPTPDGSEYNAEKGVYLAQAGGVKAISNGLYFLEFYKKSYYKKYKFYTHD
ncbi:hypothetical protein SH1V18_10920 [Vallitalea longa]|uniref:Uncharacterized protein n=1 Tax=Vallitalea longa TaxID=2936439 RepID=A0A9W5Y7U0_9FIRM|nr:hypothetical protein [Vallitalea longa]GKX28612.1 hypothetical protein SH1V18_10920 [Vallitalea longa]